MGSLLALVLLGLGIVLVVGGADAFFDGLLAVSARLRVSAFAVTAAVSGFELENVAAGVAADLKGLPDAAAGTFLGGSTFLALAVAGVAAVRKPVRAALPAAVLVWTGLTPAVLVTLALDGRLSRLDGGILVAWFALALGGIVRSGRGLPREDLKPVRAPFLRMLAGLAVLTGGGYLLGEGIERTVSRFGVSQALLGNTVVAASVEAEEVARVAVPAARGRGDVALANLIGTLVHFLALNAGVIALVRPLQLGDATRFLHLPVAAAGTLALCALVALRREISRAFGLALVFLYAAYVTAAILVSVAG